MTTYMKFFFNNSYEKKFTVIIHKNVNVGRGLLIKYEIFRAADTELLSTFEHITCNMFQYAHVDMIYIF